MMFTQRSILNRDSTDVDNGTRQRTEWNSISVANIHFEGLALIYTV